MAVSKRIRFEILRRDNHTCRYCGRNAPEVKLTVDHVTPTALGGTGDATNLVTACADCNSGKTSTSPDDSLVADVRQDALRHAEMIRQAYAVIVERMGQREEYLEQFEEAWLYQGLPDDWRSTVGRWFEMGVPIEIVLYAAETACGKTKTFYRDGRFSYFCGIVWNQVHAVSETVELKRALEGAFMTEDSLTDERIDAYVRGVESGERVGINLAMSRLQSSDCYHRTLSNVVDGARTSSVPPGLFPGRADIDLTEPEVF